MNEWIDLLKAFGVNIGLLTIVLWWLTQKLIPQLQSERKEAIQAFRDEMALERALHISVNDKLLGSAEEERNMHREDRDKIVAMYERAATMLHELVRRNP